VGLDQADKVVEELVKLIPQEDMDEVLKKELKDYLNSKSGLKNKSLP
jgi:hypothetical protein